MRLKILGPQVYTSLQNNAVLTVKTLGSFELQKVGKVGIKIILLLQDKKCSSMRGVAFGRTNLNLDQV